MADLLWRGILRAILIQIQELGIDAEIEVVLGDKDKVAAIKVKVSGKVEGKK